MGPTRGKRSNELGRFPDVGQTRHFTHRRAHKRSRTPNVDSTIRIFGQVIPPKTWARLHDRPEARRQQQATPTPTPEADWTAQPSWAAGAHLQPMPMLVAKAPRKHQQANEDVRAAAVRSGGEKRRREVRSLRGRQRPCWLLSGHGRRLGRRGEAHK